MFDELFNLIGTVPEEFHFIVYIFGFYLLFLLTSTTVGLIGKILGLGK